MTAAFSLSASRARRVLSPFSIPSAALHAMGCAPCSLQSVLNTKREARRTGELAYREHPYGAASKTPVPESASANASAQCNRVQPARSFAAPLPHAPAERTSSPHPQNPSQGSSERRVATHPCRTRRDYQLFAVSYYRYNTAAVPARVRLHRLV